MTIQRFCKWMVFSFVVLLATMSQAYAATIGSTIDNLSTSFASIPTLLSSIAYIMGCFYAITGIYKFKDHVDNPSQTPLSAGVKRFAGGGMLFTLPYLVEVLRRSFFPAATAVTDGTVRHLNPLGGGMDQMIFELIEDIAEPMTILLSSFAYISGALLLVVGISRMIKTAQDGPRGPSGLGTIMTLFVAGALLSGAKMIAAFTGSFFGDSTISTFANIDPTIISNAADRDSISAIIESLMTFVMIVGVIAFIRGLFVLRAFAEGSQNATIAQSLTFLFGGALAINMGDLVNVLGTTVGVAGLTFT